jgi:hypothetical protein
MSLGKRPSKERVSEKFKVYKKEISVDNTCLLQLKFFQEFRVLAMQCYDLTQLYFQMSLVFYLCYYIENVRSTL